MNSLTEPWYLTDCAGRAANMPGRVSSQLYTIEPGQPVAFMPLKGCTFLTCLDGDVWLTQEGSANDYILRPGKEYCITRRGKVVLQAIGGPARVEVVSVK